MHPAPRPHPVPRTTPSGACNYICPRCDWPWYLCDCGPAAQCLPPATDPRPVIAPPAILPDLSAPDRQEIPRVYLTCAWCGGVVSASACCDDGEGA